MGLVEFCVGGVFSGFKYLLSVPGLPRRERARALFFLAFVAFVCGMILLVRWVKG